jgi:hypothetical protein
VYYALVDSGAFVYIPANNGNNSTSSTTFTHTNLDQGTRYSYWITSINAAGESDPYDGYIGYADTKVDHIPNAAIPKVDEQPAVKAEPGPTVSLRWLPTPGAKWYRVYYKINNTGDYNLITFRDSGNGTLFTDTTITYRYHGYQVTEDDKHYPEPNTTYYYYVSAGNDIGWSDKADGFIGYDTTY